MSITVPLRQNPRSAIPRQQPKPEFALMAAAQMSQEGKFASPKAPQSTDALASMQPEPVVG